MNFHHHTQTVFEAAQEYAGRGWHVFPAPPGKKQSCESAADNRSKSVV